MLRASLLAVLALSVLLVVLPGKAEAYLDPGTGSAVIQMLVAGVMGALFVVKMYWQKLMEFFGMSSAEKSEQASRPAGDERE